MAAQSETSIIKGLKTKLSKAKDKIKKLEDKRVEGLKMLDKMPDVRDGIHAATFAGLTYSYYYGLVDILPKFLFQFGVSEETDWQDKAIVALTLSPAAIALEALGVDVKGVLKLVSFPAEPGASLGAALGRQLAEALKEEKEAFTAKKVTDPSGALEAAARKEAADRGEVYVPSTEAAKLQDAQEKKGLWNQIYNQSVVMQFMFSMGMAGATMLFLLEATPSKVADTAAKLLDAVTPLT